jgi:hypothetical protein
MEEWNIGRMGFFRTILTHYSIIPTFQNDPIGTQ